MSDTLTTAEAAAVLGLQPGTVRTYIEQGLLRAEKRGRDWQIARAEVARYQQARRKAGRPQGQRTQ